MTSARTRPRWFFLITPRWLAWHAFVVAAFIGMLWLGDWQFHRALSGNGLSWAYTFEWPLFAILGVVFWGKTILDELRPKAAGGEPEDVHLPPGAGQPASGLAGSPGPGGDGIATGAGARADQELDDYNAYLARLHQQSAEQGTWPGLLRRRQR